jgi:5'-deoxynucleotidase YfbR-like HD superfamily hydrolase
VDQATATTALAQMDLDLSVVRGSAGPPRRRHDLSCGRERAMKLAKMFGLLSGLSGTYRFSNAKLIHRESVLEHLGGVTLTCFLIYHELCEVDDKFADKVDLDAVLSKAVTHDVEELLMGDIPRTTKYADKETALAFKVVEAQAMSSIFEDLEIESEAIIISHERAKKDTSGMIVKIADVLAVVYKVHEEAIERGNRSMVSRATSVMNQLNVCVRDIDANGDLSIRAKAFLIDLIEQAQDIVRSAEALQSAAAIAE